MWFGGFFVGFFFSLHSPTAKRGTARYILRGWIPESVSARVCLRGESQIFQWQNMPTLSQKVWLQLEPSSGTGSSTALSSRLRVHGCSQSLVSYEPLWTPCSCKLCCLVVLELATWKPAPVSSLSCVRAARCSIGVLGWYFRGTISVGVQAL